MPLAAAEPGPPPPAPLTAATFEALYRATVEDLFAYVAAVVRDRGVAEDVVAAAPPPLALRREAQTLPQRVMAERTERAVRDLLEDFNARVRECWRRPVEGPLVVVRTVDVERIVERWRAVQDRRRPPAVPVEPESRERRGRGSLLRRLLHRT